MKTDFTFRDILLEYLFELTRIKSLRDEISKQELLHLLSINRSWFHNMCESACTPEDMIETLTNKCSINKVAFILPVKERCPGSESGRPYKVLKYRNQLIPVYVDDYGQQDFALIGGKIVSGGCYNFFSDIVFADEVDYLLEEQYLDGKYDIRKELDVLFPEESKE